MQQKIPFGKKLKDLTPLQESVLTTLYLSEKLANYPQGSDHTFYVSGKFFLYMNGIVFESYHRRLMKELALNGWIDIITRGGALYYGLSEYGVLYKDTHKDLAQSCAIHKII